ncbi:hypothetical protein B0H63DRAFT_515810 [Podospora didyma]|uniref:RRM domain-containing protein n=1 Tax=Podospora didyma TaxID=330526 RepID=A0AAE0N221_9PEZI|nr:hypothetical protein B0H63DRAFT_515810 [Podospora didyma]
MDINAALARVPPSASSAGSEAPAASTKNPNTSRTSVVGSYPAYLRRYPLWASCALPSRSSNSYLEDQGGAGFTASQYGYGVSAAYGSYSSGASYGATTPYGYTDYMPSDPGKAVGYQGDNQYLVTEKRKVYIGNIDFDSVSDIKLRSRIADYVSTDVEKQIEQIYIPPAKNGKPRGYAMISFKDVGAAQATVEALRNCTVDKRVLTVYFATEGVPTTNTSASLVQFIEQRRIDRSAQKAQEKSARRKQRAAAAAMAKSTSQPPPPPPPPPPPTPAPAKPAIAFGSWASKKPGSGSPRNP